MKSFSSTLSTHEIQEYNLELFLSSDQIKERLSIKFNEDKKNISWFSPLSFSFSNSKLTVYFPHRLFFFWFKEQKKDYFEKCSRELFGNSLKIFYTWRRNSEENTFYSPRVSRLDYISPLKSWDDFFFGERNKETLSFLQHALTLSPSTILIKGHTGTGKSLLLSIISAELLSRYAERSIIKLSGRELNSLFRKKGEEKILENCSALLIDDIHLVSEDYKTQLILSSLMDSLENHSFFLATIANDFSNNLIQELYDRLHSHTILELTEPDIDVRIRFAIREMDKFGIPEDRDIALLISRHCLKLRHMESVINSISLLYKKRNSIPTKEEVIGIMQSNGATRPLDAESILTVVASYYGCTSKELTDKAKNPQLAFPRQVAMYLCRELMGDSYPALGLLFGGRDHTTIMYAIKKIENLEVTNKDVHMVITELTKKLKKGRIESSSLKKSYFYS